MMFKLFASHSAEDFNKKKMFFAQNIIRFYGFIIEGARKDLPTFACGENFHKSDFY